MRGGASISALDILEFGSWDYFYLEEERNSGKKLKDLEDFRKK
jgi:hypothetical protein